MKLYLIKLHLIALFIAIISIVCFVFFLLSSSDMWMLCIISFVLLSFSVIWFYSVIPYLYSKKIFQSVNNSLNYQYYPFSWKLLRELDGLVSDEIMNFKTLNPFMPALIKKSQNKHTIISIHNIYLSLVSHFSWVKVFLRKNVMIEIITPLNVTETIEVTFETLDGKMSPEEYDFTASQKELRHAFKNVGLEKHGYVAYGPNSFIIRYTGFLKDPSKVVLWIQLANNFIKEHNLNK